MADNNASKSSQESRTNGRSGDAPTNHSNAEGATAASQQSPRTSTPPALPTKKSEATFDVVAQIAVSEDVPSAQVASVTKSVGKFGADVANKTGEAAASSVTLERFLCGVNHDDDRPEASAAHSGPVFHYKPHALLCADELDAFLSSGLETIGSFIEASNRLYCSSPSATVTFVVDLTGVRIITRATATDFEAEPEPVAEAN